MLPYGCMLLLLLLMYKHGSLQLLLHVQRQLPLLFMLPGCHALHIML
jgi:hypothetical protein